MHLFLTSSPCNDDVPSGVALPCIFFEQNGFVDRLRERVKSDARLVVIAADPHNAPLNDEMTHTFANCFRHHGMSLSSVSLVDARSERHAASLIALSDVLLLGGGHVPTQSDVFAQLGLRSLLRDYTGVVFGVSAGSMNCAKTVYVQPELPGESIDPAFERFIPGLGLCDVQILPHYQKVKDWMLDGRRLYDDITYEDSVGHTFIAIPDGSYVLVENGRETLFGEGYRISDGQLTQICRDGESLLLSNT